MKSSLDLREEPPRKRRKKEGAFKSCDDIDPSSNNHALQVSSNLQEISYFENQQGKYTTSVGIILPNVHVLNNYDKHNQM